MYHKFQNEARMSVSMQGGEFELVFDNVFTLDASVFGLELTVLDIQAGFQYSGELEPMCLLPLFVVEGRQGPSGMG